jgi:hypothetical protein
MADEIGDDEPERGSEIGGLELAAAAPRSSRT